MRWQRAIFSVELCIHRQHCAVNWIKVGKIIRHLRLPQFAVRHPGTQADKTIIDAFNAPPLNPSTGFSSLRVLIQPPITPLAKIELAAKTPPPTPNVPTVSTTAAAAVNPAIPNFIAAVVSIFSSHHFPTFSINSGHAPFLSTNINGLFQQYPYSFSVNGKSASPFIRSLPMNRPTSGRYSLACAKYEPAVLSR